MDNKWKSDINFGVMLNIVIDNDNRSIWESENFMITLTICITIIVVVFFIVVFLWYKHKREIELESLLY